jgi:hypothetical protein
MIIGVTWGKGARGANAPPIFFLPVLENGLGSEECCIWGESGERGVSILRTGSNEPSPFL